MERHASGDVILAKAGIHLNAGFLLKFGMTEVSGRCLCNLFYDPLNKCLPWKNYKTEKQHCGGFGGSYRIFLCRFHRLYSCLTK